MDLIREIYREIIDNSKFINKTEQAVIKEIDRLTVTQKEQMTQLEYEKYRGILFGVVATAQEEAFILGVRYGMKLMQESIYPENAKEF